MRNEQDVEKGILTGNLYYIFLGTENNIKILCSNINIEQSHTYYYHCIGEAPMSALRKITHDVALFHEVHRRNDS